MGVKKIIRGVFVRSVVIVLALVLSVIFVVVFNLFDGEVAQIFFGALAIAAALIGVGLFLDRSERQVTSRKTN